MAKREAVTMEQETPFLDAVETPTVDEPSLPWDAAIDVAVEADKPRIPVSDARYGVIRANLFELHTLLDDVEGTRSTSLRQAGCKEMANIAKVLVTLCNELGGVPTVKRGRKPKNGN